MFDLLTLLQEGEGQWYSLDGELIMRNGEVIGTQAPTGHRVLLDARFDLPYGKYWKKVELLKYIAKLLPLLFLLWPNIIKNSIVTLRSLLWHTCWCSSTVWKSVGFNSILCSYVIVQFHTVKLSFNTIPLLAISIIWCNSTWKKSI